ncbi:hypothetical protein D1BOALGB6SA_3876 [Olavius sp. associated proteobacterium Delta 1]|nr:hypothetical protein D1BOALGB6SA_3876 [Olavius sp. associated proteobacterium Delta 1]
MIITASRPYFAPFPGFFLKAHLAEILIILDDIQFPRGTTWITRNRFKNDQGAWWMTIPVWKKGRGLQTINDVRISREGRWVHKHLTGLKHAYANAPYFADHQQFLDDIFAAGSDRLIDFNLMIIRHLMLNLGVDTEIRRLSELNIKAAGDRLLIEICRYFDASVYLAPGVAARHLNPDHFEKAGIELRPVTSRSPVYPQLWGKFIADLTSFDLLFNCGPKARDIMLAD